MYERLDSPADALAAYRRAHARAPLVRNLSTLFAAQLFLANERAEAYAVLDRAVRAEPEPFDLRTMFERGSARLVPEYIANMRKPL